MPAFLENKLKAEYGKNSKVPFKVMNSIGAMAGNKETPKGAAMEKKHVAKMSRDEAVAAKGKASLAVRQGKMSHADGEAAMNKADKYC